MPTSDNINKFTNCPRNSQKTLNSSMISLIEFYFLLFLFSSLLAQNKERLALQQYQLKCQPQLHLLFIQIYPSTCSKSSSLTIMSTKILLIFQQYIITFHAHAQRERERVRRSIHLNNWISRRDSHIHSPSFRNYSGLNIGIIQRYQVLHPMLKLTFLTCSATRLSNITLH